MFVFPHCERESAPLFFTSFSVCVCADPVWGQCDAPWGNQSVGTCSRTMCQGGGATTAAAVVLAARGYGGTPLRLNQYFGHNGCYTGGCELVWRCVDKLSFTRYDGQHDPVEYDSTAVCAALAKGASIIALTRTNHFVVLRACTDSAYTIVDVRSTKTTSCTHAMLKTIQVYH